MGDAEVLAAKVSAVRIFPDDDGRMNRSVIDAGGSVMVVSQFTLLGDVRRGRRPSFTGAADPAHAVPVLEALVDALEARELPVATGRFGALMDVESTNHGPVTLVIDVADGRVVQLPT
jgi:D-tyrosyl-tRNA(Tyr) deacylase